MKALIFGTSGQVARELARRAPGHVRLAALGRDMADLTDPQSCARAVAEADADVVINAAAYTAVDRAENDPETAEIVNAGAPGAMARASVLRGVPFLHISTDYVFDGTGTLPHKEGDAVSPLGAYGASKLKGEELVAGAGGPHAILRTSWVFSSHGTNFVKTMLRLGAQCDALKIVDDQLGGPTPAAAIADALWIIAAALHEGRGETGVFHLAGTPTVSWADFAEAIFARSGTLKPPKITRIPTTKFPTPARRPLNSRLDCTRIGKAYGIEPPHWRDYLAEVIRELETST
ncbi:MAG: dTDP-4-dehydrorhamnose reductase [Rhodobacteraceae bacterium]|nr:dTDP-4-dehydrorhamnose reductase [Paracoccaceae bacterium]MCP5342333.1 dTDP-4-dehydrorhamnose reductase [Paracoccaceae bacterium]